MDKKEIYHIAEWVFAIAACAYLVWKIATYEDYGALLAGLRGMDMRHWAALALCVALMPVNMTIEAWRWKTLWNVQGTKDNVQGTKEMGWREAHRQVYYSKLAGLVTPWRLGEYPARGVLEVQRTTYNVQSTKDNVQGTREKDVMARVLSLGVAGSATMTAAIVIAGVTALVFSPTVLAYAGGSYLYALAAVALVLAAAFVLLPKALKQWAEVNTDLLVRSLGQSMVRLACWCVQLSLVLSAFAPCNGLGCIADALTLSPVYYLFVTITPNVPVMEAGVRGAWAIAVFGTMNAALAGVLLWVINTLLPCLIWPFLRKNDKKFVQERIFL